MSKEQELKIGPGLKQQMKSQQYFGSELFLSALKVYLKDIFKASFKDKTGRDYSKDGLIPWEEVRYITNISEEEYNNSSGLYYIGGGQAITGIDGYESYHKEFLSYAKSQLNDKNNT